MKYIAWVGMIVSAVAGLSWSSQALLPGSVPLPADGTTALAILFAPAAVFLVALLRKEGGMNIVAGAVLVMYLFGPLSLLMSEGASVPAVQFARIMALGFAATVALGMFNEKPEPRGPTAGPAVPMASAPERGRDARRS